MAEQLCRDGISDWPERAVDSGLDELIACEERIAALEAERDALRAALEEAIGKYDDGSWRHDDIFKLARVALAQRPKP